MAKRSVDERVGERVEVILVTKEETSKTVRLRLLRDMMLKATGQVTGREYIFNRGGSVVEVDNEDAQFLLNKKSGACDCPGVGGYRPYFELVEDLISEV